MILFWEKPFFSIYLLILFYCNSKLIIVKNAYKYSTKTNTVLDFEILYNVLQNVYELQEITLTNRYYFKRVWRYTYYL